MPDERRKSAPPPPCFRDEQQALKPAVVRLAGPYPVRYVQVRGGDQNPYAYHSEAGH